MRQNIRRDGSRRAAAMMMALVVLLVVGLISGLALQAILQSHRHTREEEQRVQAELLADAALSRAIAMLQTEANWKGEKWTVNLASQAAAHAETPADDTKFTGVAQTRVEKSEGNPNSWKIAVTAIYPSDPTRRAQALRETTYEIPPRGEKP